MGKTLEVNNAILIDDPMSETGWAEVLRKAGWNTIRIHGYSIFDKSKYHLVIYLDKVRKAEGKADQIEANIVSNIEL